MSANTLLWRLGNFTHCTLTQASRQLPTFLLNRGGCFLHFTYDKESCPEQANQACISSAFPSLLKSLSFAINKSIQGSAPDGAASFLSALGSS